MEQEARAETKKQQKRELVAEQKSWSWRKKKENLAAAWHKILKKLHTLAYFFSTNLLQQFPQNNNILKASEECVTRLDDNNPSSTA
jgi:ERCC4-type nuclease